MFKNKYFQAKNINSIESYVKCLELVAKDISLSNGTTIRNQQQ